MGDTVWKPKHISGSSNLRNEGDHTQPMELGAVCGWGQENANA